MTQEDKDKTIEYEGIPENELSIDQLRQRNADAWFKRHPEVLRNGQQGQKINKE
jgi:hypothetical protein